MPLYDFVCRACGHQFEALVRASDAPPECPECRGTDLERLMSSFVASSEEGREKAARASRQQQIRGRRDQLVAEAEYRKQHDH
jgi:putative FmdB family regulatory protein